MTDRRSLALAAAACGAVLVLAGCASESEGHSGGAVEVTDTPETVTEMPEHDRDHDHGHDHPEDGGPAPAGMTEATDPTYPVGTEVILEADHMPGMQGAKATIVGAFDGTYTYAVSYDPTDGGERVTNHKWVVQQELEDAGTERLADGTEKVITANHMSGMEGATATIDSSTDETVYMVDVEADGMTMKNHKWVVESEIKPAS